MKNVLPYLFKLSICVLLAMFMEGIATGYGFTHFEQYTLIGWIAQGCIIVICLYYNFSDISKWIHAPSFYLS